MDHGSTQIRLAGQRRLADYRGRTMRQGLPIACDTTGMFSSATVTVSHSDSIEDVVALRDWLSREDVIRSARLDKAVTDPGAQGGVLDTISLILTDGAALVAISDAVRRWLATRRKPSLTVTINFDDATTTVTIDGGQ